MSEERLIAAVSNIIGNISMFISSNKLTRLRARTRGYEREISREKLSVFK